MDTMAIATLSMNMAQSNILQEVNVALMRNAMDHAEQTGEMVAGLLAAIPAAVPPVGFDGLGANIDIMI
ncbi:MAG: YjfB family protein [Defluviitaleaceae bacterium]|nr:YjfB family protein [Defluviitaleaceae bacterium]